MSIDALVQSENLENCIALKEMDRFDLIRVSRVIGLDFEWIKFKIKSSLTVRISDEVFDELFESLEEHVDDTTKFGILLRLSPLNFNELFQEAIENKLSKISTRDLYDIINGDISFEDRKLLLEVVAKLDNKGQYTQQITNTIEEILEAIQHNCNKPGFHKRFIEKVTGFKRSKYPDEKYIQHPSFSQEGQLRDLLNLAAKCNVNGQFNSTVKNVFDRYAKEIKMDTMSLNLIVFEFILFITVVFSGMYSKTNDLIVDGLERVSYLGFLSLFGWLIIKLNNSKFQIIDNARKKYGIKRPV